MRTDMISICLSVHDENGKYLKYAAVTIASVLLNTSRSISVYLLHDETLREDQKRRLADMVNQYGGMIHFLPVELKGEWHTVRSLQWLSIGTLFRLLIPDIIPDGVRKIIYLDADTLVDMDIKELWEQDFNGAVVLGRNDIAHDNYIFEQGVARDKYINAGVMLLDLDILRKNYQFLEETTAYLKKYPDCRFADQDAINYVLNGRQGILPLQFNIITLENRSGRDVVSGDCIYHFAGDYPHLNGEAYYDRLFFDILEKTPFVNNPNGKSVFCDAMDYYCRRVDKFRYTLEKIQSASTIVFWGAKETHAYKEICSFINFSGKTVYFVDQNESLWGEKLRGYEIKDTNSISDFPDAYVIVLAHNHYGEISASLELLGLRRNENYVSVTELIDKDRWMKEALG